MDGNFKTKIVEVEHAIDKREALLNKILTEINNHEEASDVGWWLTLAGEGGGTAIAVSEGIEARRLLNLVRKIETDIMLLHVDKRILQYQADNI